mmetsp:Transcript_11906/g.27416  ORF Transcript_11906/g.27416 Transcript_11906/m.27416 type:complete len:245 (-) Transcript_11906:1494-2228(-)
MQWSVQSMQCSTATATTVSSLMSSSSSASSIVPGNQWPSKCGIRSEPSPGSLGSHSRARVLRPVVPSCSPPRMLSPVSSSLRRPVLSPRLLWSSWLEVRRPLGGRSALSRTGTPVSGCTTSMGSGALRSTGGPISLESVSLSVALWATVRIGTLRRTGAGWIFGPAGIHIGLASGAGLALRRRGPSVVPRGRWKCSRKPPEGGPCERGPAEVGRLGALCGTDGFTSPEYARSRPEYPPSCCGGT